MKTMSPEAQRVAIAEVCGWRWMPDWRGDQCLMPPNMPPEANVKQHPLPDYLADLNSMHEAWLTLDDRQQDMFAYELSLVVDPGLRYPDTPDFGKRRIDCTTKIIGATAAQRARAFLRVVGRWTA